MYECSLACVYTTCIWYPWRLEEDIGSSGTGIRGKPSDMGAENRTWVLCKCLPLFTIGHFSIPSYVVLKCELCRQMVVSQQRAYFQQSGIFVIKSTWNESRKHSRTYSVPDGPCLHTPGLCYWCFAGSDPVAQMGLDFMMILLSQPLKYWDWRCVPLVLLLYLCVCK